MTPYELWIGKKAKLKLLSNMGFFCPYLDTKSSKGKLDVKTITCAFVGYPKSSIGYRCTLYHNNGCGSHTKQRYHIFRRYVKYKKT